MTDLLPIWIQNLTPAGQYLMAGLLILFAVLALLSLFRTSLYHWRETCRIIRAVKRMGARFRRDIAMPDGMGSNVRIDFLVLSPDALLVVSVKRYDGMIFGSAQTDEWIQTINSRSYKFPNPDTYLARQVTAVRAVVPKAPVRGLHLFTDAAVFPWDKPANVLLLKELCDSRARRPKLKDIPADLRTAWTHVRQHIHR